MIDCFEVCSGPGTDPSDQGSVHTHHPDPSEENGQPIALIATETNDACSEGEGGFPGPVACVKSQTEDHLVARPTTGWLMKHCRAILLTCQGFAPIVTAASKL